MGRRILWMATVTMLLAAGAWAQRGGGRNSDENAENYTPSAPNRLDRVADYLKLSHEQKRDFEKIMDAAQKEAAPLREPLIQGRTGLGAAIAGAKGADEIGQATKSYADVETRMAAIELKAFVEFYKLLDDGQKQKISPVFIMMNGVFRNKNWMQMETR